MVTLSQTEPSIFIAEVVDEPLNFVEDFGVVQVRLGDEDELMEGADEVRLSLDLNVAFPIFNSPVSESRRKKVGLGVVR